MLILTADVQNLEENMMTYWIHLPQNCTRIHRGASCCRHYTNEADGWFAIQNSRVSEIKFSGTV